MYGGCFPRRFSTCSFISNTLDVCTAAMLASLSTPEHAAQNYYTYKKKDRNTRHHQLKPFCVCLACLHYVVSLLVGMQNTNPLAGTPNRFFFFSFSNAIITTYKLRFESVLTLVAFFLSSCVVAHTRSCVQHCGGYIVVNSPPNAP